MGGMLVNLFVRSDDQATVVEAAKQVLGAQYESDPMQGLNQQLQAVKAMLPKGVDIVLGDIFSQLGRGKGADLDAGLFLVSPSINGWVGLHDSLMQSQDESLCSETAREISRLLHTTAISFLVHDGDFLRYWLAKDGEEIAQYHSMPGYVEDGPGSSGPSGGNAELLAGACGVPEKREDLAVLLSQPDGDAIGQLQSLGQALGIVDAAVDFDLLTYKPPKMIGFTVPEYKPDITHREQYVTITKKDLGS